MKTNGDVIKDFIRDYNLDVVLEDWATDRLILQTQKDRILASIENDTKLIHELGVLLHKYKGEYNASV